MSKTTQRRGPGRPPLLTRERIIDVAIAIVEETGTLRVAELGRRLGVDTSTMYRYFENRSDLVSAMAETFTAPLREPIVPTDNWRNDITALIRRVEVLYRSHPSVALMTLGEADLSGASLQLISDGAAVLRRSGASDRDIFVVMHGIEFAVFGSIGYDSVGGTAADEVRRTYYRRVGVFDVDDLFPTAEDLAAESSSTLWLIINGLLDWLEARVRALG